MNFDEIKYIVFTPEVSNTSFIQKALKSDVTCIPIMDTRSAVYTATGICAQSQETVIVCVSGSNASRSAFSGMTEAYYRNLPLVLMTFGSGVNYSVELADIIHGHYTVQTETDIFQYLQQPFPIHIEVNSPLQNLHRLDCEKTQMILQEVLTESDYLYFGQGIQQEPYAYKCKVVVGGMPGCMEGALANVLGASLSEKHRRYVGLVSEEEMSHDINTLGNINVNDRLIYVVVSRRRNGTLEDCAKSLFFEIDVQQEKSLTREFVEKIMSRPKKTVLFIYKEEKQ